MEDKKFKVIIVEDVKLELKGTEEIFRHEIPNAEVIGTAMTESEFWTLIEAGVPDLVLLDLGLGGSTTIGVDICRNIFKRYPGVHVLIFTGEILNEKLWVENPSEYMLSGKPENASGSVVACAMEGTRPMLMEIQALVCKTNFGMPRRTAAGLDYNRVNLLMAVLEKRMGMPLSAYDAYVNIAGGIRLNEPAADLGIVMAIASSYKNRPIDEDTIVFGEVGLSGEVRAVTMPEQRVSEAKKLGFKRCIVPAVSMKTIGKMEGIEILGVENVNQAMNLV